MQPRNLHRLVILLAYVLLIFFVSSRPYLSPPGPQFEARDKVAHFFEYLVLGVLLFKGIGWSATRNRALNFLFLVAVGVSIGALDELFQSYTPGRSMSLYDWLADTAGLCWGIGLFVFTRLGARGYPSSAAGDRGR